ncbi:MAG TPA: hypothetical protein VM033_04320 [Gemmatimonadaceae bacterium]|nr:hypothetical protein [Gemmatimonadaceae bacterium]
MKTIPASVLRAASLVILAASIHGCSDSGTGPSDRALAGLDEVLTESSLAGFEGLGATLIPSPPVPLFSSSSSFSPASCSYDGVSQSFVCAPVTNGGLTIERSFILFDAAGNRQAQFVRGTTAAVQTKMHVSGTLSSAAATMRLDHLDDRTVSGLLTTRHVLNGTSAMTMDGTFPAGPGGTTPMPMSTRTTTTTDNLVLPSKDNPWPGPGSMTTISTSTFGSTLPPMASTMRAVFNGTKCVSFTFITDGHTQTMVVDLSNPRAVGCTA